MPPDEQTFRLTIINAPVTGDSPMVILEPGLENGGWIAISHGYPFETTYDLTGTNPISVIVTVKDLDGNDVLSFIHNASTRTITAPDNLQPGIYAITIEATNSFGVYEDTFELVVEAEAPAFVQGDHDNYVFGWSVTDEETKTFQINVTGSTPISYSLKPTQGLDGALLYPMYPDMPDADAIFINEEDGELTIRDGIAPGLYYFTIVAENSVGPTEQQCMLWVNEKYKPEDPEIMQAMSLVSTSLTLKEPLELAPIINFIEVDKSFKSRAGLHLAVIEAESVFKAASAAGDLKPYIVPLNDVTIRWDDKQRDVYTHDRDTVNGAAFISWDSNIWIMFDDLIRRDVQLTDPRQNSPVPFPGQIMLGPQSGFQQKFYQKETFKGHNFETINDSYHIWRPWTALEVGLDRDRLDNMGRHEAETIYIPGNSIWGPGSMSKIDGLQNYYQDTIQATQSNLTTNPIQLLDFGLTLTAMNSVKGGQFDVQLDTITTIVGDYFVGLKENKNAKLSFIQEGATITFAGKDVKSGITTDAFLDIAFTAGSNLESKMIDAMGVSAGKGDSFIYSFAHHGDLPGTATFEVKTEIAAGSLVNVYRYDNATDGYTLISEQTKVAAGGVVKYKNNSMSDYLITTETISGAAKSDMVKLNEGASDSTGLIIGLVCAALILAAVAVAVIVYVRKNKTEVARGANENT